MRSPLRHACTILLAGLLLPTSLMAGTASRSAYNGHPKLIVIVVMDQFRGDYLDRYRDGFRDASLLEINAPSHSVGRVLTEALTSSNPATVSSGERP